MRVKLLGNYTCQVGDVEALVLCRAVGVSQFVVFYAASSYSGIPTFRVLLCASYSGIASCRVLSKLLGDCNSEVLVLRHALGNSNLRGMLFFDYC